MIGGYLSQDSHHEAMLAAIDKHVRHCVRYTRERNRKLSTTTTTSAMDKSRCWENEREGDKERWEETLRREHRRGSRCPYLSVSHTSDAPSIYGHSPTFNLISLLFIHSYSRIAFFNSLRSTSDLLDTLYSMYSTISSPKLILSRLSSTVTKALATGVISLSGSICTVIGEHAVHHTSAASYIFIVLYFLTCLKIQPQQRVFQTRISNQSSIVSTCIGSPNP